jgi:surface protein
MFYLCDNLLSISKNEKHFSKKSNHGLSISKNKEKEPFKIIDFNFMFFGCESMISIPDISEWNMMKVTDCSNMFYSSSYACDLSGLKINQKAKTSYMFSSCPYMKKEMLPLVI